MVILFMLLILNYIISINYIIVNYETMNYKEYLVCVTPFASLVVTVLVIGYFLIKKGKENEI